jgi:hypothetical protein
LLGKRAERRCERARSKRNKKFAACIQFTPLNLRAHCARLRQGRRWLASPQPGMQMTVETENKCNCDGRVLAGQRPSSLNMRDFIVDGRSSTQSRQLRFSEPVMEID